MFSHPPIMDLTHSPELLESSDVPVLSWKQSNFWLVTLFAVVLWGVLCRMLGAEWSVNEQYSYGWFVPAFAVYLFWLRWPDRPIRESGRGYLPGTSVRILLGAGAILLLLAWVPIRLFEVANPEWRPLEWVHALLALGLSLSLLWLAGGWPWLRYFAFPVAFVLVAVPWVTPIEVPIIQGLQHAVAIINTELMNLIGIPAQLEGSVIRLRTGLVGVNEACSGVRSLQTSIMAGLLFGELNRMNWRRRVGLLGAVVALAFVANVMRGGFLVWTAATKSIEAVDHVHDAAGLAVLGIVMVGTFALANVFRDRRQGVSSTESNGTRLRCIPAVGDGSLRKILIVALCWLVAVEIGVEAWYRLHEKGLLTTAQWSAQWPEKAPGYAKVKIDEMTRSTLRYDKGGGAMWRVGQSAAPETAQPQLNMDQGWLMYFFRWEPGQSSVLRARAHRPDVCFPNTGWRQTEDRGVKYYEAAPGLKLPFRHFGFIHSQGRSVKYAHAFFCLQADKVSARENPLAANNEVAGSSLGDWNIYDRIRMVREARRDLGQQVMEIVITTDREVGGEAAEAAFARELGALVQTK
ncbi:MAG: exosortase/archaeosortase family protein [Chthoniobacterales bacterium]